MSEVTSGSGPIVHEVPLCGTVDGVFSDRLAYSGVHLGDLPRGAIVHVDTRHSRYRLVVLDGTRRWASVLGGDWFDEETVARINGSRIGDSALKVGWIGVGFRIEMSIEGRALVTSRVRSITIEELAGAVA
jgi:hypothetical protein